MCLDAQKCVPPGTVACLCNVTPIQTNIYQREKAICRAALASRTPQIKARDPMTAMRRRQSRHRIWYRLGRRQLRLALVANRSQSCSARRLRFNRSSLYYQTEGLTEL